MALQAAATAAGSLCRPSTVALLLHRCQKLQPLAGVRCLSGRGSRRIVLESPIPPVVPLPGGNYAEFALSRADAMPDKPALVNAPDGAVVTYGELRSRVRCAAGGLARAGFGPGQVLAMVLHNCPEFVVAQLAAILAGGSVTLVNPQFTPRELTHHLGLTGATMLVTCRARLPQVMEAAASLPCLRSVYVTDARAGGDTGGWARRGIAPFDDLLANSGQPPSLAACDPNGVAAIPFSSGTTGLPKGVTLSHANLTINALQLAATGGFADLTEVCLGLLPCFHISGFTVVSMGLVKGYTTVLMPQFEPESLLRAIETHQISQMALVPPLVLFLLQHPLMASADLSSVRLVLSAAAPLSADVQRRLKERLADRWNPAVDVIQAYGGTEMSPLTHVVPPPSLRPTDADYMGSVGVPVSMQRTRVVSPETGEDLGPGETGEIVVTGPHMMLGYYKDPKATADAIRDGWYHTGDVGWYDKHGQFFITDRLKELIKVKGFQVAPAELEALLLACPGVADAGVIGVPHERLGEAPFAFVVRRSDAPPGLTESRVTDWVAENAAAYKRLEGGVRFVSAIPRNPSGKILRRILREGV